jgi:DNA-binding MarR family transcriptional regulator
MSVASTSRQAYAKLQPKIGEKQQRVYEVIYQSDNITNNEIAQLLGWEINRVTGRVNELVKLGLVEFVGTRACMVKGTTCKTWRIKPVNMRLF